MVVAILVGFFVGSPRNSKRSWNLEEIMSQKEKDIFPETNSKSPWKGFVVVIQGGKLHRKD